MIEFETNIEKRNILLEISKEVGVVSINITVVKKKEYVFLDIDK